ncbi:MAG: PEP-CTERM sorting domain-containing protein [Okeania sp. SIO2F4]|uniref:choice-of-anchor L domain-containing protein n=1 Tax=Okeania sp. SIO2F4 TaxID=2607790 RepID=UPI00142AC316|nr:choice-of-anchor L domain-containing protein [Okeania sp. SIO2F4]NES03885.1 PEP-CTERM sorting domain-containing protein [Okeania sp. SIO2F4]
MTTSKFFKKLSMAVAGTAFISLSGTTIAQAISITPTSNGNELVGKIIDSDSGITIVQDSIKYTGANVASGIFTDGLLSGIGIDKGIILTTGTAKDAEGPNHFDGSYKTRNGLDGDPDLDTLITGSTTKDATTLEFQFDTEGGDVFFNYVFASEEYNEFVNTEFNDVFGFFLDGKNIALIPGTTTPVAINTVNGGRDGKGEGDDASHPEFFNNNDKDNVSVRELFDLEYDGFTNVFTAQALGLNAGSYTMKLAIADTKDDQRDSAVFIQAKSFSDAEISDGDTSDADTSDGEISDADTSDGETSDAETANKNTQDAPKPSGDTSDWETLHEDTSDVETSDWETLHEDTSDGETANKNTQDIPEPSVVMGLLAIGFAGLLPKKKNNQV